MSWTRIPGIRQDHRGRYYRILVNSRGKQDLEYIDRVWDAPKAYTIPVPPEPKPVIRLKPRMVRDKDGTLREFKPFQPRRFHYLEFRIAKPQMIRGLTTMDRAEFEGALASIRPLMQSPDCGKTWQPVESLYSDWHVAYHL